MGDFEQRRAHERFECLAQIELRGSQEVVLLPIKNISMGGALLAATKEEQGDTTLGDALDVFLALDELDAGIYGKATVKRLNKPQDTIAIEWTDLGPESEEPLRQFIRSLAEKQKQA